MRLFKLAVLVVGVMFCSVPIVRCDEIKITASDLKSIFFQPGTKIGVQAFQQRGDGVGNPVTNFVEKLTLRDEYPTFEFKIDVNDPKLTNGLTDADRTIAFIFTRDGQVTATVRFITVGAIDKAGVYQNATPGVFLNVAVPEPQICLVESYPSSPRHRIHRGRLFRR